jgi:hypothetical protein
MKNALLILILCLVSNATEETFNGTGFQWFLAK